MASYSPEKIAEILADRDRGFTRPQLAEKYGVHVETVERWEKKRKAAEAAKAETLAGPIKPADIMKLGGEAPAELTGMLQLAVANMPLGTPEEVIKAAMVQKIVSALEKSKMPPPKTIKDYKDVYAMLKGMLDIGKPAAKGGKNVDVTVRLDRLGMKPIGLEVVEAEVISEDLSDPE